MTILDAEGTAGRRPSSSPARSRRVRGLRRRRACPARADARAPATRGRPAVRRSARLEAHGRDRRAGALRGRRRRSGSSLLRPAPDRLARAGLARGGGPDELRGRERSSGDRSTAALGSEPAPGVRAGSARPPRASSSRRSAVTTTSCPPSRSSVGIEPNAVIPSTSSVRSPVAHRQRDPVAVDLLRHLDDLHAPGRDRPEAVGPTNRLGPVRRVERAVERPRRAARARVRRSRRGSSRPRGRRSAPPSRELRRLGDRDGVPLARPVDAVDSDLAPAWAGIERAWSQESRSRRHESALTSEPLVQRLPLPPEHAPFLTGSGLRLDVPVVAVTAPVDDVRLARRLVLEDEEVVARPARAGARPPRPRAAGGRIAST